MDLRCTKCGKKLARKRKTGLCKVCLLKGQVGENNPNWKGEEGGVHMRIKAAYGSATEYICTDCGEPAKEWSWEHGTDKTDIDNYNPRCYPCHRAYDYDFIHSENSRRMNSEKHKKPWSRERWNKQHQQAEELWMWRRDSNR